MAKTLPVVRRVVRKSLRGIGIFGACVTLAACTPQYRNHGYAPTDDELAEIVVGFDSRGTVEDVIGAPSAGGVLRDSGYYYVSQRISTYAYQSPVVEERQVVAIRFDDNGVVSNIERFGLEDGNVVALSRRVSASNIEGIGFLRQLMGNLGRLDAAGIIN
jgi:outer membrane protein assembly factor BamE (lipoprotein component of BamABCDE complex)